MGKTLVLAEKPSVARELARVLECRQKDNGFIAGQKYIVTWALGHLVTLADPDVYNMKYKSWKLEDLPMLPKNMELVVIKETAKQFATVKKLLFRSDVDELVIATDAGREGELVARWIVEKSGFKKPMKRLWISSQTDKAIKEGFANLRPSKDYDDLYKSAKGRSEADWLVGLNVTRALTCKYNAQLSAGRVQTPTLSMIVEREKEIKNFVPKEFWTINALFRGFTVRWQDSKSGAARIFDKALAEDIVAKINGSEGTVIEVKKEAKKELQPLAYDLTELQRDANRKYGYSAKQTLNIMQKLYETHKLVTYPRTDSKYLTDDMAPILPTLLKCISIGPYKTYANNLMRSKLCITKRLIDNSKVSDHHAIIPTDQFVNLAALNAEERHIYDLIVKRFLAVLSPPFEYEQTTVKVETKEEILTAKGKIVKSEGWKAVYSGSEKNEEDDEEDDDQSLPEISKSQTGKIEKTNLVTGKTKPPKRYTEATLLSAMEHPAKFVDDKTMKDSLETTGGLGTPATRADIIEKLFNTFCIERKGKEIYPTSKGIQLIDIVPSDLKSPELTAKWEQNLAKISHGSAGYDNFVLEMRKYATKLVSNVIADSHIYKHDNLTREKCNDCGSYLLEVNGKKGKMLVCPDRECGFRKSLSQTSNARCPECHKKMEIKGEGSKKGFFCSCGYRESMENFKKRREEHVDKKDIGKFMKEQNKSEGGLNTSLADALSKWKSS